MIHPSWQKKVRAPKHNSLGALSAKIDLRRWVLSELAAPARVLDIFCGPVGEMFANVWREASAYSGIDKVWLTSDKRRRFVGDNEKILRSIDLNTFNVFDIDAFGSPWEIAVVLAARRSWGSGERGAVVFTDGGSMGGKLGATSRGVQALIGISKGRVAPGGATAQDIANMARKAFFVRSGVVPIAMREAIGTPKKRGAEGCLTVVYSAAIFEGMTSK